MTSEQYKRVGIPSRTWRGIALGIAIGAVSGVALDSIAIGVALGVALGLGIRSARNRSASGHHSRGLG